MFLSKLRAFLPKHKGSPFLILIALLFLGATVVYAGGGSEVIYACVGYGGRLRVVESFDECSWRESELLWNQVGPEGPIGPPGPAVSFYYLEGNKTCAEGASGCQAKMTCDSEDIAVGGGYVVVGKKLGLYVYENRPVNNVYYIEAANPEDGGLSISFNTAAVCADYPPYRNGE